MSFAKYAFCVLLLIGFAGCTRTGQENAAQQAPPTHSKPPHRLQPQQVAPAPEAAQPVTAPQPAPQPCQGSQGRQKHAETGICSAGGG